MKIAVLLLIAVPMFAQNKPEERSKPAVAPLTAEEKLTLRNHQHSFEVAQRIIDQQVALRDAAQQEIQKEMAKILATRKIEQKDIQVCDGPGPGPCEKIKVGELEILPVK